MGLDMYLSKRFKISSEEHEVGYWRKSNQIHNWFVKKVQDGVDECQESYVLREQLEELLQTCKAVKANPELAPELLPSQGGFFFGSTDYDEWYFHDIDQTIEILENELEIKYPNGRPEYYYQSSW
jgi:hypothetical protein